MAMNDLNLSVRAYDRILKVGRTISVEPAPRNGLHVLRHRRVGRIQGQLLGLLANGIKHLGNLRPCRLLAVVNLDQIKQRPLHPTTLRAHLPDNAPVTMIL